MKRKLQLNAPQYLGDGVYATFDGFHVVLSTEANVIYLDDSVLAELQRFVKRIYEVRNQDNKEEK